MTDLDLDEAVLAGLAERIERGGLMDLSDWRSVILALMRDREGLRARNAELEDERDEAQREYAHLQRCMTMLSLALSHRSTEHIRDRFKGNTPEIINCETDELTVIFADLAQAVARIAKLEAERDEARRGSDHPPDAWVEWLDELDRRRALAEIAAMRARVRELEAERDELEDTLEWYASEDRYHYGKGDLDQSEAEMDEGRRARAALEAARGEEPA
jgi:nucleoside-diphosphate-sugar epimerase